MPPKPANVRRGGYKCGILEMHLQLRDQQLKAVLCIYIDSYIKTSWLPQTKNLQWMQFKHNTKDSHQTTREENKRGREEKRPTKKSKTINEMVIRNTYR